jgi:hypothetical protein
VEKKLQDAQTPKAAERNEPESHLKRIEMR